MKKRTIAITLLATVWAMTSAQASQFDGGFVGGKAGNNSSDISGGPLATGSKDTTTWGIDEGYNWDMDSFLLGADFFVNVNHKADHATPARSYSSSSEGLGLKFGVPMDNWMPYVHLGYAKTKGGYDASKISAFGLLGGLGVEYKFAPNWGVNAEWSGSSATGNGSKLNNDNVTVGVRYYFGSVAAAPATASSPASATAPGAMAVKETPKAEPVAAPAATMGTAPVAKSAPAPQSRENWKTILTEKPVLLEGANFATGSSKLLKTANVKLNEVVNAAKQYPEVKLEASGHTDSLGNKARNQKLSENRAASVKAYLVKHGVAADRISTVGYADTKPIADNKTKAGRAANRRVEVRYVIKESKKVRATE